MPTVTVLLPDDPRRWAVLLDRARRRKGWSHVRLAVESGVSLRTCIRACTRGHIYVTTLEKLVHALELTWPAPCLAVALDPFETVHETPTYSRRL